jgi:hypothetical protein
MTTADHEHEGSLASVFGRVLRNPLGVNFPVVRFETMIAACLREETCRYRIGLVRGERVGNPRDAAHEFRSPLR